MNRKIVLHIGAPKCGSTYLQRVMLQNQRSLRSVGVNYPHLQKGHPGNANTIDHVSRHWIEQSFSGFDTVILSHENLFSAARRGQRLVRLCADAEIDLQVVAFLRPFEDWLIADYSQTLRQHDVTQPHPPGFLDFIRQRRSKIRPGAFLCAWQSVVGKDQMTVQTHRNIRSTLLALCPQLDDIDWTVPKWRCNRSMPLAQSMALQSALATGDDPVDHPPVNACPTDMFKTHIRSVFQAEAQDVREQFGVLI